MELKHSETGIKGIYEGCIGVSSLSEQIAYWKTFGYEECDRGSFSADQARRLYGHSSPLESVRLAHQHADHGLIRLMAWDVPTSQGLGLSPMKTLGGRWMASLTRDVTRFMNHVDVAQKLGMPIKAIAPQWAVIYEPDCGLKPFQDALVGVREMLCFQPLTRQVLFQRFNYSIESYGQIATQSLFQSSQMTHFGLIVQSDRDTARDFYSSVMGLMHIRDCEDTYEDAPASRAIFELNPKERYFTSDFDDPRSHPTDYSRARSGRLKIVRFEDKSTLKDLRECSRPGALGLSLYTYRVPDVCAFHRRISQSQAGHITSIENDEFHRPAFSFRSPDGYDWTIIQDAKD